MADTKVTGAQSTPAFIERLDVFSNKDQGKTVSIVNGAAQLMYYDCLLYTSPSPRDATLSRMPSSA